MNRVEHYAGYLPDPVAIVVLAPFIGVAAMLAVAVAAIVIGWLIYGVVAWMWLWLALIGLVVPTTANAAPTTIGFVAMMGGLGCHMYTIWVVLEKWEREAHV